MDVSQQRASDKPARVRVGVDEAIKIILRMIGIRRLAGGSRSAPAHPLGEIAGIKAGTKIIN